MTDGLYDLGNPDRWALASMDAKRYAPPPAATPLLPFRAESSTKTLDGGSELTYAPGFFDRPTADALFAALLDEVPWPHKRTGDVPEGLDTHWMALVPLVRSRGRSHTSRPSAPWLPTPNAIRIAVESLLFHDRDAHFAGVLLRYYPDGHAQLRFRSDKEEVIVPGTPIARVSLGAPRRFVLRHDRRAFEFERTLEHGSLLVMARAEQWQWQHAVPPQKGAGPTITLSFRRLLSPGRVAI